MRVGSRYQRHAAAPSAETRTATFVGRRRDLRELLTALDEAAAGRGSLALISGEPGIGKTRLAQELAAAASARRARMVWGSGWAGEGAPPYWPWIQVVRSLIQGGPGKALLAKLGEAAGDVARVVPEIADRIGDHTPTVSLAPEHERFRVFDAVGSLLEAASGSRPLVVVLDDLHEADEPSLRLLAFIASRLPASRVFVLGTHRDVEREHPLARMLADLPRDARRLPLEGLTESDVARLVQASITEAPSPSLVSRVHGVTGGNPFFVQEVLRLLPPGGEGRELDADRIPRAVREVLEQRLARLSDESREVVSWAAVVGQEFGVDVLPPVTGRPREEVVTALDEAAAARIVEQAPASVDRYAFAHALLRETVYAGLGKADRRAAHARVAPAIEELASRAGEAPLEELAYHFSRAGPEATTKAVEYAERAGRRALDRLAYEEAADHFERALQGLELIGPAEERRLELLLTLAEARKRAGATDSSREALGQAADLARRLGRPEDLARAALGFRSVADYYAAGTIDEELVRLLEEALESQPAGDSALRARVMAQLSWEIYFADLDRSVALAKEAVDMARRVGDPLALGVALDIWHDAVKMLEGHDVRLAVADEMVRLGEETPIEELALWGHRARFEDFMERGEIHKAEAEQEIFSRLVERLRDRSYEWWPAMWKTMRAFLEGRFQESERLAKEALAIGQSHHGAAVQHYWVQLFLIRDEQGRLEEIEPMVRAGAETYRALPGYRARLGLILARTGRTQEARAELERLAADDFAVLPRDYVWDVTMAMLSELCGHLQDARRAAGIYERLEPFAERWVMVGRAGTAGCRGPIHRYLGILAATMEKWDRAEAHFEAALEETLRTGALTWLVHTQHEYASMLLERRGEGDEERAAGLLRDALEAATGLGMTRLTGLVRDLSATMGPAEPAVETQNTFRREGDVWSLSYAGEAIRMKDAKGLRDIALLLASPGREVHVADLIAASEGAAPGPEADRHRGMSGEQLAESGLGASTGGDTGPILDDRARSEYRARIAELQETIEEADRTGDAERATRAREEMEVLTSELASAYGLGGRLRASGDPVERARKAVTTRIRYSIARIKAEHPVLARHLDRSIKTGTFCAYQPEQPAAWEL